jgi:hypothetical protein
VLFHAGRLPDSSSPAPRSHVHQLSVVGITAPIIQKMLCPKKAFEAA